MKRLLAVVLVPALLAASPARAAEPAPIRDVRESASRLEPLGGGFDDPAAVVAQPEPEPEPEPDDAPSWSFLTAHGRYVTMPGFLLDLLFESHPSFANASAGIGYEFGTPRRSMWIFDFDWAALIPESGNWQTSGDAPSDADYVASGLHLLSLDVSYLRFVSFFEHFHFFIGGGLGVGFLVGNLETAEVLPTCEAPAANCAHWRTATNENADLPTRIIPILHVTTGFQFEIGDDVLVRLSVGFRDVFYAGLTVGMTL